MVRRIREQAARLFKILGSHKKQDSGQGYTEIWFPATRNNHEFDYE